MDISPEKLLQAVTVLVAMVLSLTVHEYAHALAAKLLGDDTAERQDRLTLNPISHIDAIGTIGLPLLMVFWGSGGFFGWAKPVPFDPGRFKRSVTMRTGTMLVASAGPLSNIVLAIVAQAILAALYHSGSLQPGPVLDLLLMMRNLNVVLAVFNLLPVQPLDGHKVLSGLLPLGLAVRYERFNQQYGTFMLLALFVFAWTYLYKPVGMLITALSSAFGTPA